MAYHATTLDEVHALRDEVRQLRAALKDLFLLACVSQDIDAGSKQMKAAGKLLAAEQSTKADGR